MIELFKHVFDFIFLKTKKNSIRLIYFIAIILAVLLVNDYFGISKNLLINRRLNQLEKLNNLIPNQFESDSTIVDEIRNIKNDIFDKKTFVEKSRIFISKQFVGIVTWRNFSASFTFLLGMLIAPFIAFTSKNQNIWKKTLTFIVIEIVLAIVAFVFIKSLALIPQFQYAWINHLLNYLIQIIVLFSLTLSIKSKEELSL